jgi:hypothetical protein
MHRFDAVTLESGAAQQGNESAALQQAISRGERDENRLTDLLFNARHPERRGQPLRPGESQPVREWLDIRDRLVQPALQGPVQQPPPTAGAAALAALSPLTGRTTQPTVANAVAILKPLAAYWNISWRLPFTILEHEGGVRLFRHHDGVMQTIAAARQTILPALPRPLKLMLLGLPAADATPETALAAALEREFHQSLAVQIAAGTQELVNNLREFNGYVALAFVGYNAGSSSAYWVATGRSPKARPRPTGKAWEDACRIGATLLHQSPTAVDVKQGVWRCDANLAQAAKPGSGWFRKFEVRDRRTGRLLIAYQYLRSVKACIPAGRPGIPCGWRNHRQELPGSGRLDCSQTRIGALDKLHDPGKFASPYRQVAQAQFSAILDDGWPLKAANAQLAKVPPAP